MTAEPVEHWPAAALTEQAVLAGVPGGQISPTGTSWGETMRMRPYPEGMSTSSVRRPMTLPAPSMGQAENRRNTAGQGDAVISVALA